MTRVNSLVTTWLSPLLCAAMLSCTMAPSQSASTGGTGSEVTGTVQHPDSSGTPKRGALAATVLLPVMGGGVFIHPESYLMDTGATGTQEPTVTLTDSTGFFRISHVLPGNHIVYIRDNAGNAIAAPVTAPPDSTTIDLGTLLANPTGRVQIMYTGGTAATVLFYLTIRGTGLTVRGTGRDIYFELGEIPTGATYTATVRVYQPAVSGYDVGTFSVTPGQLLTLSSIIGQ